uniref:Hexose transporter 1 n=2 Tax=Noctiluca scintillans TaxID=2966 RepID=A0A7S1AM21_NOCSC|mmetsp:Transcript_51036/g.136114  ORF Transcript_51036/g.136114 Transcript_51036/m.136114 type:complete len:539 (+) Transcript_51036:121-1737(+)
MRRRRYRQITWRLMLSVISATLGASFQFGFSTGFVNNMEMFLLHYFQTQGIVPSDALPQDDAFRFWWSLAVSAFAFGGMLGTCVFPALADRIGRKETILSTSIFSYLACYFMAFPRSWFDLILGRVLVGIGAGGACGAVPSYVTEIAPNELRGTLGTVHQLMITLGILVSQTLLTSKLHLLGNDQLWHYSLLVPASCTTFLLFTLPFCADSPPFLLRTKGEEAAKEALSWFRPGDYQTKRRMYRELRHMYHEMELADRATLWEVFSDELLWKPMLVGIVVNLSMQFSGIDAVFFYSTSVFLSAGIGLQNAQFCTTLIGLCNVLVTIPAMMFMDLFGRKTIQSCGLGGMCVSYVIMTVGLVFNLHFVSVTAMLMIICFFALGPGCIAWFIIAELVPMHARCIAISMALGVNWCASWFISFIFPHLLAYLKKWTFATFAASTFVLACYTHVFLPETKGKTVLEVRETFYTPSTKTNSPALHSLGEPLFPEPMPTLVNLLAEGDVPIVQSTNEVASSMSHTLVHRLREVEDIPLELDGAML